MIACAIISPVKGSFRPGYVSSSTSRIRCGPLASHPRPLGIIVHRNTDHGSCSSDGSDSTSYRCTARCAARPYRDSGQKPSPRTVGPHPRKTRRRTTVQKDEIHPTCPTLPVSGLGTALNTVPSRPKAPASYLTRNATTGVVVATRRTDHTRDAVDGPPFDHVLRALLKRRWHLTSSETGASQHRH